MNKLFLLPLIAIGSIATPPSNFLPSPVYVEIPTIKKADDKSPSIKVVGKFIPDFTLEVEFINYVPTDLVTYEWKLVFPEENNDTKITTAATYNVTKADINYFVHLTVTDSDKVFKDDPGYRIVPRRNLSAPEIIFQNENRLELKEENKEDQYGIAIKGGTAKYQESPIFENLQPNVFYSFYVRTIDSPISFISTSQATSLVFNPSDNGSSNNGFNTLMIIGCVLGGLSVLAWIVFFIIKSVVRKKD